MNEPSFASRGNGYGYPARRVCARGLGLVVALLTSMLGANAQDIVPLPPVASIWPTSTMPAIGEAEPGFVRTAAYLEDATPPNLAGPVANRAVISRLGWPCHRQAEAAGGFEILLFRLASAQ